MGDNLIIIEENPNHLSFEVVENVLGRFEIGISSRNTKDCSEDDEKVLRRVGKFLGGFVAKRELLIRGCWEEYRRYIRDV